MVENNSESSSEVGIITVQQYRLYMFTFNQFIQSRDQAKEVIKDAPFEMGVVEIYFEN